MPESADIVPLYHHFQTIYVLLDALDRHVFTKHELTPSQYNLLRHVENGEPAGLTITGLAAVLLCTRGNATRQVRRIEEQGLLTVRDDPDDQRLVRVFLAPLGRKRLKAARQAHTDALHCCFAALKLEDRHQLSALMQQTIALLEARLAAWAND